MSKAIERTASAAAEATSLVAKSRAVVTEFVNAVEDVRRQIGELNDRAADIRATPVPREEAIRRLDRNIGESVADARGLFAGSLIDNDPRVGNRDFGDMKVSEKSFRNFMLAISRKELRAFLVERIDASYASRPGMSDETRRQALAEIDADRLKLELAAEAAIRQAETVGIVIARRRDADPRAVLADESELPSE